MSTGDAELDKQLEMLQTMGGINFANVSKLMNLPDLDDMDFDPAGTFQSLTGVKTKMPLPGTAWLLSWIWSQRRSRH